MPYALSGGHETTLEIAEEILLAGGNAFDAAIAAHLAMYVTEPCMASAGAGGFALCYRKGESVAMLDFFTQTPRNKKLEAKLDFDAIQVNFGNEVEEFHTGMASIATPGSIAGIFEIYRWYASMPFERIIEPVIELSKIGLPINKFQSIDLALLEPIFARDDSVADSFFKDGKIIGEGDHFSLPRFTDFLEFLSRQGRDGFYKGEISRKIDEASRSLGGYIRRDDLEQYEAIWRKPLTIKYHGRDIILANGPSIGGPIAAILFSYQNDANDWLKSITRIKEEKLGMQQIEDRVNAIYGDGTYNLQSKHQANRGTSHFNIVDGKGNAIAFTCTIGEGAGWFIPGTDMHLNNMLGEAFLLPEGFHNWTADVRLNSMMSPAMVFDSSELKLICGSGGAGRIPYMIAQMVSFLVDKKMPLDDAMLNPRIYLHHGVVHYETGYAGNLDTNYPTREWFEKSLFFGGVHSISVEGDHFEAMGDPRRYGAHIVSSS